MNNTINTEKPTMRQISTAQDADDLHLTDESRSELDAMMETGCNVFVAEERADTIARWKNEYIAQLDKMKLYSPTTIRNFADIWERGVIYGDNHPKPRNQDTKQLLTEMSERLTNGKMEHGLALMLATIFVDGVLHADRNPIN